MRRIAAYCVVLLTLLASCYSISKFRGVQTESQSDITTIESGDLKLEINTLGAELFSIEQTASGREYLWGGDAQYWKFRSPVLFPIIGALYNNEYRVDGVKYEMMQHGIARHKEFEVIKQSRSEAVLSLKSDSQTRESYPYDFILNIGYKVEGSTITITYEVTNPSQQTIYFQLGAHPGFNFMNFNPEAEVQGYFTFNDKAEGDTLACSMLSSSGYTSAQKREIALEGRNIAITAELFKDDALIFEGGQCFDISLLDTEQSPYLRVRYDAPVVGLWSKPCDGYAPFVCIEPWYGRCDSEGYSGEFKDRDWTQSLAPNESFTTSITIDILG